MVPFATYSAMNVSLLVFPHGKVWRMLSAQGRVRDKGARQFIRGTMAVTGYNIGALEQEHRPPSKKEARVDILVVKASTPSVWVRERVSSGFPYGEVVGGTSTRTLRGCVGKLNLHHPTASGRSVGYRGIVGLLLAVNLE